LTTPRDLRVAATVRGADLFVERELLLRETQLQLLQLDAVIRLGVDQLRLRLTHDRRTDDRMLIGIDLVLEMLRLETTGRLLVDDLQLRQLTLSVVEGLSKRRVDDVELQQLARVDDHAVLREAEVGGGLTHDRTHLTHEAREGQRVRDLA